MELSFGMAIDPADLECLVESGYERAGISDPDASMVAAKLIRSRFGNDAIAIVPNLQTRAQMSWVDGKRVFAVRASLSLIARRFSLAHEYAHVLCEEAGYEGDDLESVCDYLGAAIQARRRPFMRAIRSCGADFGQLAFDFGTSESWAALRYGETTGTPMALVAPKTVRVRGTSWEWGSAENVRGMAMSGRRGLVKTQLSDDCARVALVAEAT